MRFQEKYGTKVNVIFGPTSTWEDAAKDNADLIFSGSEIMMHEMREDFNLMGGTALYLRPVSIIVRSGNPKKISGIDTLLESKANIMVVNGAGQKGLWEDVIGRTGRISSINKFSEKIKFSANNSAEAVRKWKNDNSLDALIIWNHWIENLGETATVIPVEEKYRIYRPVSIAYMPSSVNDKKNKAFVDFLSSEESESIFNKYGWKKYWPVID